MGYHKPVLLNESIAGLDIKPKGIYVDLTFGGGGHSREVLKMLGKNGRLIAFDQDRDAEQNIPDDKRVTFVGANFRYLRRFLRYLEVKRVDGILADLGVSSHQIDEPDRGFSFRAEAELDMRMDRRNPRTAALVLNQSTTGELARIFRLYGELGRARELASAVERAREERPLQTTGDLQSALSDLIPKAQPSKFLARVYQSLRIEVNRELDSLERMLLQTSDCLADGGRLVLITYHSLEDRIVKNFMRSGNLEGAIQKDFYGNPQTPWRMVNRSVITPSREEMEENKRARSAKLRIAKKL